MTRLTDLVSVAILVALFGGVIGAMVSQRTMTGITINMQKGSSEPNQESRYSVRRVGVFEDDLSFNRKRGIYEITDEKNNKKYLGVSGIGMAEWYEVSGGRYRFKIEQ